MKSAEETSLDGNSFYYRAKIKNIYTGDDIAKGEKEKISEKEYDFIGKLIHDPATEVVNKVADTVEDVYHGVKGVVDGIAEITENFAHNPVGTLITLFLDLVRPIFGDFPQFLANMIQTPSDHTFSNWQYMYSRKDIEADDNLNKYTEISDYKKGDRKDWKKVIDVEK